MRSTVLPVIRRQVSALEPTLARICSYHLGFTDENGHPGPAPNGKLTRSALMLAAADGVGVRPEAVRCQAAALELLHNATLVHDDIIDGDELRRGRPAAWKVFGTGPAILAGDALQSLALRMVVDDPGPGRTEISGLFAEVTDLVLAGQAREFTVRADPRAGTAEYERIVEDKTSALLECALVTPALRAGRPQHVVAALRGAGRHLGLAFQILNDVEDIWGDPSVTGKPVRSDIERRNPSFPVLAALSADGTAAGRLRGLWDADGTSAAYLQELADLVEECGGRHTAEKLSRGHLDSALEHLGRAGLTPAASTALTALFDRIVHRTP
ncbi:polyprenyl synthetase family protein [Streptomyces acidiscabies]|uniref:Polyprenyl synthetase family protein n=1 Tax=Streptomyces acidiscabies TaxID=42234 RepID=A0AAP6EHQ5_9ACTN|nr:polyprenyl synthetase family protein [Streptomyces acidiscabies]MBZ3917667.1 polyprenyl synthetase family protein [Streptomyces acidiscabies]MDX2962646.1 polyprenyl synthetase family protein [Streptomyces acidiscabies]MDX3025991.1 polyprenyl synthetase family protein [Streptomyces acidiscabies]MDX3796946.1 polyprenyl synthetase family protein [Streptomyces acidiscabies]